MKKYKKLMVVIFMVAATMGLNAQEEQMPTRSISYGNTAVDYSDSYRVLGRRHDQLVMVGETDSTGHTPYYWKARTIDGWYGGAFAGANYDFGQKAHCLGYAVYAEVGYTAKWFDFAVSAGYSRLANPFVTGQKYGAWSAFFEPSFVAVRWNKDTELNRFYIGGMFGLQQALSAKYFSYEDDYIVLEQNGGEKAFGLALGGKIGYEWRMYMGGLRIGVEARVHTYAAKSEFTVSVDDENVADQKTAIRRWQIQVGVVMKGVFGRSANNFATAVQ